MAINLSKPIYLPNTMCIIIASHMSKSSRIPYLIECLKSHISATIPITIYLSISFETFDIKAACLQHFAEIVDPHKQICVLIREQKTPQMRHIQLTFDEMRPEHEWILFCDDDDTYVPNRVERFAESIVHCINLKLNPDIVLAGVYESTFGKEHREQRHEFWCYCVRRMILERFLIGLKPYPDVLDNKCCDVLFGEYLRRSKPHYLFAQLTEQLYNYRIDNNTDSVTGFIKMNQHKYSNITNPPPLNSMEWSTYVLNWNDYLHDTIDVYLHDIYLRTLVGMPFEDILVAEFKANRPLLEFIDVNLYEKMVDQYNSVRLVCDKVYDHPF